MRNGGPRRHGRPNSGRVIKPDPDSHAVTRQSLESDHGDVPGHHTQNTNALPNSSLYGQNSSTGSVTQSFNQQLRSDAPPPSEPATEIEPLFREVRPLAMFSSATNGASKEDSFFHSSFKDIGRRLKEFNDTLGELQQLGMSHDLKLPELVLIGDQSAGKSSLMSGLAHLDLPRSEGTCTRCPLHIRVSRNTDWSCRVSLRREYSYHPPQDCGITEDDVTDSDPFFPWKKMAHMQIHEFKTMHDNSEIESVLRWAQIAILNDSKSHKLFIPGSGSVALSTNIEEAAETTQAKFSPNIVSLEIRGPDFPDLSFYDMPGIFQNPADARDDYLVSVVRNLSKAYIEHTSAIVICSMPMNSDAENSATFGLTRKLNASGRTIGVLTKADLLPVNGKIDQWLAIMRQQTHQTGLGYFVTSRPPDKDLDECKEWEERFFTETNTSDWPIHFHEFQDRCGVEKLKAYLSERLGEQFARFLPEIKRDLKHKLQAIKEQLYGLPELPENVELEIKSCLMTFSDQIRIRLDSFVKNINTLPMNFKQCLLDMKPKFVLKDNSDCPIQIISDSESDATTTSVVQTPSRKRPTQGPITVPTPKRQRSELLNNGAGLPNRGAPAGNNGNQSPRVRGVATPSFPEPFTQFSAVGRGFRTLAAVREEIQNNMKAGMPGIIPEEVYEKLVLEAMDPWNGPTREFLTAIVQALHNAMQEALVRSLGRHEKRFIFREVEKYVAELIEQHRDTTMQHLIQMYEDETSKLLTFNTEAFTQYFTNEKEVLQRFRHHMRLQAAGMTSEQLVPYESVGQERLAQEAKKREAEMVKLGPDKFEKEVDVIAYVRSYYKLAALRFADNCAQNVICRMIPNLNRSLVFEMHGKLGIQGSDCNDTYERLMAEDEQTATLRRNLKGELLKFETALRSIEQLEANFGETSTSFTTERNGGDGANGINGHDVEMHDGDRLDEL